MNLLQLLIPDDVELRFLLRQLLELQKDAVDICILGQEDLIGQHRLQNRGWAEGSPPKPWPGKVRVSPVTAQMVPASA